MVKLHNHNEHNSVISVFHLEIPLIFLVELFETIWDFPVPDSDRKYQLFQLLGFNGIPLNTI